MDRDRVRKKQKRDLRNEEKLNKQQKTEKDKLRGKGQKHNKSPGFYSQAK